MGLISLPHSVQTRLTRHLLCARLERALHCRSARFHRDGPKTGAQEASECSRRGKGTLQGSHNLRPGDQGQHPQCRVLVSARAPGRTG